MDSQTDKLSVELPSLPEELEALSTHFTDLLDQWMRPMAARINRGIGGREVALCITKVQEARMWVGEALEELRGQIDRKAI